MLPLGILRVFDEHELVLLIGGMTEDNMHDWTWFTDYCVHKKPDRLLI